jgi:hypothetical protein
MFDVYLNDKRDLLVMPAGALMPMPGRSGKWRKKRRTVLAVSAEINMAVKRDGYYLRARIGKPKRRLRGKMTSI